MRIRLRDNDGGMVLGIVEVTRNVSLGQFKLALSRCKLGLDILAEEAAEAPPAKSTDTPPKAGGETFTKTPKGGKKASKWNRA